MGIGLRESLGGLNEDVESYSPQKVPVEKGEWYRYEPFLTLRRCGDSEKELV